jgi:hypothetical protein
MYPISVLLMFSNPKQYGQTHEVSFFLQDQRSISFLTTHQGHAPTAFDFLPGCIFYSFFAEVLFLFLVLFFTASQSKISNLIIARFNHRESSYSRGSIPQIVPKAKVRKIQIIALQLE